ncbi:hypothetical protein [Phaeodactylibacter sp.]|uniref:HYC_CC_PP family protein n=1 Tax=Phaeodactylibacter sp. TaxID=1940289 RepID=UPI0025ED106B|nr:hypothetical protein [Phaeodactylibacter sp.]MCI5092686.1 hypothetical protein [Phaeodactylibacter sp.]
MITKAFHILLAVLLLISSTGLVLSKHYCNGDLKSTALFAEAAPCHQNKKLKSCPAHGTMPVSDEDAPQKKGCCDTETDFVKVDDDQVEASLEFNLFDYPALFATLVVLAGFSPVDEDDKSRHYFTYKPPLLICDLPVRLQTFLC